MGAGLAQYFGVFIEAIDLKSNLRFNVYKSSFELDAKFFRSEGQDFLFGRLLNA